MANGLISAAVAEVALISYRDFTGKGSHKGAPMPRELMAVAVVYGVLGFFPDQYQNVAALLGWGLVIATALKAFSLPGSSPTPATLASAAPAAQ